MNVQRVRGEGQPVRHSAWVPEDMTFRSCALRGRYSAGKRELHVDVRVHVVPGSGGKQPVLLTGIEQLPCKTDCGVLVLRLLAKKARPSTEQETAFELQHHVKETGPYRSLVLLAPSSREGLSPGDAPVLAACAVDLST